jgi:hypothetical protein
LGVDKWWDISRIIIIIIDDCVDPKMLVGNERIIDSVLTAMV